MPEVNPSPDITNGPADLGYELPPGNHANEIAARSGFGPLSPLADDVWHGRAMPCVSCGQLVRRAAEECPECGQDLGDEMLDRMLLHAGPWYVHEHVRPFPGVTRQRIVRQILRGVLNETSIVRGPETDHQWRFAVETPGLCRYFDKCWCCHGAVQAEHLFCPACLSDLRFFDGPGSVESEPPSTDTSPTTPNDAPAPAPIPEVAATATAQPPARTGWVLPPQRDSAQRGKEELAGLRAALKSAPVTAYDPEADASPRIFGIRLFWVSGALLMIFIVLLVAFVQWQG